MFTTDVLVSASPACGTSAVRTYLQANLRRKQKALLNANAVIAVSSKIAADLKARAPALEAARIEIIPNPVNTAAVRERAAATPPMAGPYALYVGKLAPNKGTSYLVDVIKRADLDWPLVIVGDGPDRVRFEEKAAHSGKDIRLVGWLDPAETATWLSHASLLLFPIVRTRVAEPGADRSERARHPDRSDEHGGHPRHHRGRSDGSAFRLTRGACGGRPTAAQRHAAARTPRGRGGSARERKVRSLVCGSAGGRAVPGTLVRVVIVARSVFPIHGLGGLERSVYDLARHLAMRDMQVTVITRTPRTPVAPDAIHPRYLSSSSHTGLSPAQDAAARR